MRGRNAERGIAYGVGVCPGDSELMTYKAARLIWENDVIAVPGKDPREAVADTTAMGDPVQVGYTSTFYCKSLGDKSRIPQEAAK